MKLKEVREFRQKIRSLDRLLHEQRKEGSGCSVSPAQCHALLEIENRNEANVKDLAESMALDKSTMSRTIDGLVQGGFVERIINPQDRRYMQIKLTDQGWKTCDQTNQFNDEYFKTVLEELPEEKQKRIMEALDNLIEAMHTVKRKKNEN